MTRAFSGRPAEELDADRLATGDLQPDDVRIHPDTLAAQADVAQRHGNPQLADNLRRAAELALVPEEEVLGLYEALRPHRSSAEELVELARRLDAVPAPRCAALVREAGVVYARRGLLRRG